MLFPTIDFALFFGVVYVGAWLLNTRVVAWKLFVLAASYFFYAYWDWRFCFLLLASTLIAHIGATGISLSASEAARKGWLVASLVGLLGLLGYFKYYGFFAVNVDNALRHLGMSNLVPLLTPTLSPSSRSWRSAT
jgi:D-alanyl-lipoteichoic acid acyltransferase DltB (MBOAT superfamily)